MIIHPQKHSFNELYQLHKSLGIRESVDYDKFHLYAIIAHSTAIEGSTITVEENQILLDYGNSIIGKNMMEQMMNLDLKEAYDKCRVLAEKHCAFSVDTLQELSASVMRRTGTVYDTMLGPFDSSKGDLRLVNVSAGYGGDSYITYSKVPSKLKEFCEWLNTKRQSIDVTNPETIYRLSFEAHLRLVTIHPWVDGNGRMSRLLMNHIQFEYDLIPTIILKEDKEQYIKALKKSQSDDDPTYFVEYMITIQKRNLFNEVVKFKETLEKGINAKSGCKPIH